ncbi:MAG: hypothetical protein MJZ27_10050 [Bacteroidales bacterium]|nr:hypothetical protein [Bacteroidales bacterium]MCQ2327022.1 hypothetical protein [Bacteroidales bacterium]
MTEVTRCREVWLKVYKDLTGLNYYWTGKDGKSMQMLINKIRAIDREVDMEASVEVYCRKAYQVGDEWVKEHYSLAILNSQFNELYRKMKNGRKAANNVSSSYAEQILRELHS